MAPTHCTFGKKKAIKASTTDKTTELKEKLACAEHKVEVLAGKLMNVEKIMNDRLREANAMADMYRKDNYLLRDQNYKYREYSMDILKQYTSIVKHFGNPRLRIVKVPGESDLMTPVFPDFLHQTTWRNYFTRVAESRDLLHELIYGYDGSSSESDDSEESEVEPKEEVTFVPTGATNGRRTFEIHWPKAQEEALKELIKSNESN